MRRHQTGAVLGCDPCDVSCVRCHVSRVTCPRDKYSAAAPTLRQSAGTQQTQRHRAVICKHVTFTLELETKVHTKVFNHRESPYQGPLPVESAYYTSAFSFKTLLRYYAKHTLTPR